MKKKKVTTTDIAKRAGVSQSTVSMVLNKKYNVSFSKETTQKVEQAVEELGYKLPAKKIKNEAKREKLLVIFCPNLTNPYYVMLLQGIETKAKEEGYGLFICNTQRNLKMEEQYLKMMTGLAPKGIIYLCNPSSSYMEMVEKLEEKIPVVIVNNQHEKLNVDAVELDNTKIGSLMAKHLIMLGHKDIAFITPPLTIRQKQRSKRVEGFIEEYTKIGLKNHVIIKAAGEQMDEHVSNIDSEYKIGYELTKELLEKQKQVTAIVGLNDMIAFGILEALYEEKKKVPGDISVMGCDNTLYAGMKRTALTTVEHFIIFKGKDACEIIMKKIKEKKVKYSDIRPVSIHHVEYEPQLVVRGTTGYAKQ